MSIGAFSYHSHKQNPGSTFASGFHTQAFTCSLHSLWIFERATLETFSAIQVLQETEHTPRELGQESANQRYQP